MTADHSIDQTPLSAEEKIIVKGLWGVLNAFVTSVKAKGHKSPPVAYLTTFMLVASEPGLSVDEYAARAKRSKSTMSRHLLDIGDRNRDGHPGLGLVTSRPNPTNRRQVEYMLTPRGRALATQLWLAEERMKAAIDSSPSARPTA
jgi:DNA-binding MarR family transcriptional regulator